MWRVIRSFLLLAVLSRASAAESVAEVPWSEIEALLQPSGTWSIDRPESYAAVDARLLSLREKATVFARTHPDDPRRWRAWAELARLSPIFALEFNDEGVVVRRDDAKAKEWAAAQEQWIELLWAAHDVPADIAEQVGPLRMMRMMLRRIYPALPHVSPADWAKLWQALDEFARRFPNSEEPRKQAERLMYSFDRMHTPAESRQQWSELAQSANAPLAAMARDKLALLAQFSGPVELKFTAADGREVDLAKLRGKVVLLDFWATWCVPCMMQKPHVIAAYREFHDQGFEIVGISLDVAPDPAKPAAWTKTAEQLVAFANQKGMPWPQHYDGKGRANIIAQRFGVTSIPASFLLDKEGRVVAMNLRDNELTDAVRRLIAPVRAATE